MDLQEFDRRLASIVRSERQAQELLKYARFSEQFLYDDLGIYCVARDPGFPCWTTKSVHGYYNTPREAYEATLKNIAITKELSH